jgi:uncharacterized protein YndB with AHSA1/START domain
VSSAPDAQRAPRAAREPAADAPAVVRTSVDIAAPPDAVFEALTDPAELAEWWGSEDTYRTKDWTVDPTEGGAWRATTVDPDGREGALGGTFTEVDAPRVLETTWRTSWDDAESTVRWELAPAVVDGGAGTRLTVTHTGPTVHATACLAMAGLLSATYGVRTAHCVPRTSN